MRSTYALALVISVAALVWIGSGMLGGRTEQAPAPSLEAQREADRMRATGREPVKVRARVVRAEPQSEDVVVRGSTASNRTVSVRTEVSGRVADLPLDKGDIVAAGDLICRLEAQDREARVREARADVDQARIEFEGSARLQKQGFQTETAVAGARARLAGAEANLERRELELANTAIRAPFAGVIEHRPVEIGDLLQVGGECATVVEQNPLLITAQVSETDVGGLRVGGNAAAELITGERVRGTVKYIGREAQPRTRTYPVEIEIPNPDYTLRSGVTATLGIPVRTLPAHRVAPSLLGLDDAGRIGIRILDDSDRVRFVLVDLLKDEPGGVWITGLPEVARIITVGQELVVDGDLVEAVMDTGDPVPPMPAAAPVQRPGERRAASTDADPAASATRGPLAGASA